MEPKQNLIAHERTNSKLAIRLDDKSKSKTFKFQSKNIKFPNNLPCEIRNFEIFLNVNQNEENGQEKEEKSLNYTGGISGVFSVPKKEFFQPFYFPIPFSIKFGTAIALGFATSDFQDEQMSQLNRFIFGEETIKPIALNKNVALDIAAHLLEESKNFEKLRDPCLKAINFIKNPENKIAINFLIDHTEQLFQIGFFWKEFHLDGMPEQIKIQDIMFGLSLDLKKDREGGNKFALKIGGKASYGKAGQNSLYCEYELSKLEQRLELGGTISCLTSLLESMSVKIPPQIQEFSKDTSVSIEWVADVTKMIPEQMKLAD
jgi:hypothetical protein